MPPVTLFLNSFVVSLTLTNFGEMAIYSAIIEQDKDTGLFVGHVPDLEAHSQGETIEELRNNLREALSLILEEDENYKIISYVMVDNYR